MFFAHWIGEIEMKRLADNLHIIPTLLIDIYRYFDSVVKHMPQDSLKTSEKHFLYSKN